MATTVNVTSNYEGKEAGKIFGKAFKEADTLRLGMIDVYQNVNYKLNMRLLNYADGTKAYSCIPDGGFSDAASGAVTTSEKVLEPVKLMLPLEICLEDFRKTWSEDLMGRSAHNPNVPQDINEAIDLQVLDATAERTDEKIWTGDNTNTDEWDGFIKLFENDANVIKAGNGITSLGSPIEEANIEAELKKFLKAIPRTIRRNRLRIAVSPDVFQAYWFYLVSKGVANDGNADTKQVRFGKYVLTELNGLPDNTFVAYEKENLAFGTGLLGDHNQIKSEYDEFRGMLKKLMVYNGGVQYANSDEIVYYNSTS